MRKQCRRVGNGVSRGLKGLRSPPLGTPPSAPCTLTSALYLPATHARDCAYNPITVFAPTNAAFLGLAASVNTTVADVLNMPQACRARWAPLRLHLHSPAWPGCIRDSCSQPGVSPAYRYAEQPSLLFPWKLACLLGTPAGLPPLRS